MTKHALNLLLVFAAVASTHSYSLRKKSSYLPTQAGYEPRIPSFNSLSQTLERFTARIEGQCSVQGEGSLPTCHSNKLKYDISGSTDPYYPILNFEMTSPDLGFHIIVEGNSYDCTMVSYWPANNDELYFCGLCPPSLGAPLAVSGTLTNNECVNIVSPAAIPFDRLVKNFSAEARKYNRTCEESWENDDFVMTCSSESKSSNYKIEGYKETHANNHFSVNRLEYLYMLYDTGKSSISVSFQRDGLTPSDCGAVSMGEKVSCELCVPATVDEDISISWNGTACQSLYNFIPY